MDGLSIADELALLRETYKWTNLLDLARMGYVSLMVYDIILCLPTEIEVIWKARWTFGKALYLFCRYSSLVYIIICTSFQFLTDCRLELHSFR
ncbi:hypothetical protein SCHPADRAFT_542911 [Schizopora paradoxa]|uniref:DUF6533 domain-containing protein n=1 Tax=Schizopora paradoxa TaxID=27342 RepID=A0A0H2REF5_9AGAM|nr:hypothetical protein SCHPADRAFT_542911 [Schizopora paradoxa]